MKQCRFIVPVIALIFVGACFGQDQRPGPDPVQRAVTQARNAGRLADAEKLLRDAIHDLQERDPKSLRLTAYLKQLSALVTRRGDNVEAASILQQAYELELSSYGPDDLRLTVEIANLAWLAHGAGEDQKAEQMFNHVLEIVRSNEPKLRTLGDAEFAGGALGTVISYYTVQKRWVDAEVLVPEDKKLCDMIPSEIRDGYCINLSGVLDEIYRGEGRHAEAAQLAPESPFPAELDALNKAANKFMDDGVYPSAEDTYNRAILLAQRLDADPQSRFNGSLAMMEMDSLARLYEKEGAKDKAERAYLAAQEMREKRAGSEPSQRGYVMSLNPVNLIYLYQNEGRFQDAEAMLQRVFDVQVKYLGEKDRRCRRHAHNARRRLRTGRRKRRGAVHAGTSHIRTRALAPGIDDWTAASTANSVATAIGRRPGEAARRHESRGSEGHYRHNLRSLGKSATLDYD